MARDDHAIVVGITRYPGLRDLAGPENDARDFRAWLIDEAGGGVPEDQVKLIVSPARAEAAEVVNERPTNAEIELELERFIRMSEEGVAGGRGPRVGRRLYVYVAGHGVELGSIDDAHPVLLTANATEALAHHVFVGDWVRGMREAGIFEETVFLFDACRSRVTTAPPRGAPITRGGVPGARVRWLDAFASQELLSAYEKQFGPEHHGVFSRALLAGLRGAAREENGDVTALSLSKYLWENMKELLTCAERDDPDVNKQPEMDLRGGAELILVTIPTAPALEGERTVELLTPQGSAGKTLQIEGGRLEPVFSKVIGEDGETIRLSLPVGLYRVRILGGDPAGFIFQVFGLGRDAILCLPPLMTPYERVLIPTAGASGTLRIEAADSVIFVLDASFRVVARSFDRLETALPAGLYKAQTRIGNQLEERLIAVEPEPARRARRRLRIPPARARRVMAAAAPMMVPPPRIGSPAPLVGTFAPEPHARAAERESRRVHATRGAGSRIFVCVRDEPRPATPVPYPDLNPAAGLVLQDIRGPLVADLEQISVQGARPGAPWAACTIEVDPGAYLLSVNTPDARLRQTIIASSGWQTEVYLLLRSYAEGPAGRRADLSDAAFLYSRVGFDPADPEARQTELARLRQRGRQAPETTREQLEPWLSGEIEQPMLLLLGLQEALRQRSPDEALRRMMRTGLTRLRGLIGEHPDVEALAMRIEPARTPPPRFTVPPMLRASWDIINEEARERPEIIPPDSLLARIATRLWGQRPALVWREPRITRAGAAFPGAALEAVMAAPPAGGRTIDELVSQLLTLDLRAITARPDLDAYERAALDVLMGPALPVPMEQRLVRALDVPQAVVLRVLSSLHLKAS